MGVVADAGVGKSRLCLEFVRRLRGEGVVVSEAHPLAHASSVPFATALELWRLYFGIADADDEQAARQKVANRLLQLDASLTDALPLIVEFLGVGGPDRDVPTMSPEARQSSLFRALNRLQQAQRARDPEVILVENLHWLHPGSETFLESTIEAIPDHPLSAVLRSEGQQQQRAGIAASAISASRSRRWDWRRAASC